MFLIIPAVAFMAATNSTPVLLPVHAVLNGAGCTYSLHDDPQAHAVLVVEFPDRPGSVRIRIGEDDLVLAPVEGGPPTYSADGWRVEVRDLVEDGPQCEGGECEGSRQRGMLRVQGPDGEFTYAVRAHCGA